LEDLRDKTISNAVGERNHGQGNERRDSIANIGPVDLHALAHHQTTDLFICQYCDIVCSLQLGVTYNDEGAASGPGRDGSKDWRKEERDQEANTADDGSKASSASLSNASTTLDKGSHRGAANNSTQRDHQGVSAVCPSCSRKVTLLAVGPMAEPSHGVESGSAVNEVHIEEGEERQDKVELVVASHVEIHCIQRLLDWMESYHLLEVVESVLAVICVREVCERGVAPI
jgi:hypothetical protein